MCTENLTPWKKLLPCDSKVIALPYAEMVSSVSIWFALLPLPAVILPVIQDYSFGAFSSCCCCIKIHVNH